MGLAQSTSDKPPWWPSPDQAELQILTRTRWLTDEWDRIDRKYIKPQKLAAGNDVPEVYTLPPTCFVARMISDYTQTFEPKVPPHINPHKRIKMVEDQNVQSTHLVYKEVPLDERETLIVDRWEEYQQLVENIRRHLRYDDGQHEQPDMEFPGKLTQRIIDYYRKNYIEVSSNMQLLASEQMQNEWQLEWKQRQGSGGGVYAESFV